MTRLMFDLSWKPSMRKLIVFEEKLYISIKVDKRSVLLEERLKKKWQR